MLRKILLAVLITCLAGWTFAQQGALKGKIVDAGTKEPIPFANVVVELGGAMVGGGISDFDGNYTIKPIPAGKFTVKASYVGYKTLQLDGVVVNADKIRFLDLDLETSSLAIEEVVVIEYVVPLIDKDNTQTGGTVTSEDIAKMSGRSAAGVASTVGGVYQEDGEVQSVRGARQEATTYYIDGMKVRGTQNLPKSSIEQVAVVTGGLAAKYGDATGGIISITTKGPSRDMFGGIELMSSQFLDPFNRNLVGLNLSGPLFSKKTVDPNDPTKVLKKPVAGFFISGEVKHTKDAYSPGIGAYRIKDDVLAEIIENPLVSSPDGQVTNYAAEFLNKDDFEHHDYYENVASFGVNFAGKIDIQPSRNLNITLGGTFDYNNSNQFTFLQNIDYFSTYLDWGNTYGYANQIMNSDNYPQRIRTTWRTYLRITQKFGGAAEDESAASVIKNAYYSIQADYTKDNLVIQDEGHKDDFFNYGYIGRFTTEKIRTFSPGTDTLTGMTVRALHDAYQDIEFALDSAFPYGKPNPELSKHTENYYEIFADRPDLWMNSFTVQDRGGLLNGDKPTPVYTMINLPGEQYDGYFLTDNAQIRVSAAGAADVKDHEISMGFEFEQRVDKTFNLGNLAHRGPVELWELGRSLTNFHIQERDLNNPYLVFDNGSYHYDSLDGAGTFLDTIYYNRLYNQSSQALFDIKLRQALGLPLDGTEWVDIDALDPSLLSLDFFSADELFNSGNQYVEYAGYDHHGNKLNSNPSFEEFFTATYLDEVGNVRYKREIAPFSPTYMAAYIQDKFAFNDLVFNVGVRVDRYDANQKVLKDEYLVFDSYRVGDDDPRGLLNPDNLPDNIGDGYAVYVNNSRDPSQIVGYRDGRIWYNADGAEINDPQELYVSGVINPYLVNANDEVGGQSFLSAFGDYEAQVSVMPRISFSFPISDVALFFAHYDVLTKRPIFRGQIEPWDYLYIYSNTGSLLNNPNLKPEKTIDYELGFQQKITNTSSLKLSTFYREMRDMAQVINNVGAYPVTYKTFGNIDFGTVKGLTVTYDLRRTGNVSLRASYTMQFATGTGSNSTAAFNLISTGQPNLRVLLPYDFDQRHAITGTIDYRFGSGNAYNGPKWFGTDILSNTGVNFVVSSGSGSPYSRRELESGYLVGSINGSNKPWRTTVDMKIDKDIELLWGKGEEDNKKSAILNIYVDVLNLFDKENILEVYEETGNPDDDGYITKPANYNGIEAQLEPDSFRDYYSFIVNNPGRYSLPRRIRLGVQLSF